MSDSPHDRADPSGSQQIEELDYEEILRDVESEFESESAPQRSDEILIENRPHDVGSEERSDDVQTFAQLLPPLSPVENESVDLVRGVPEDHDLSGNELVPSGFRADPQIDPVSPARTPVVNGDDSASLANEADDSKQEPVDNLRGDSRRLKRSFQEMMGSDFDRQNDVRPVTGRTYVDNHGSLNENYDVLDAEYQPLSKRKRGLLLNRIREAKSMGKYDGLDLLFVRLREKGLPPITGVPASTKWKYPLW